jgi:hypothetical protein
VTAEPPKMVKFPAVPKSETVWAFTDQEVASRPEMMIVAARAALEFRFMG